MLFWHLLAPLLCLLAASHHHLIPLRHPSMPPDRLLTPYSRPLMPPHHPLICNCHLSLFNVFSLPFMRLYGALRPFLLRLKTFSSPFNSSSYLFEASLSPFKAYHSLFNAFLSPYGVSASPFKSSSSLFSNSPPLFGAFLSTYNAFFENNASTSP